MSPEHFGPDFDDGSVLIDPRVHQRASVMMSRLRYLTHTTPQQRELRRRAGNRELETAVARALLSEQRASAEPAPVLK